MNMNSKKRIYVVFNAMSTHPGGGLTVLLGVLDGLQSQNDVEIRATVICSIDATREAIESQGIAACYQPLRNASGFKRQWWTKFSLSKYLKDCQADILFSINQYIPGLNLPQVVYHLNLTRFLPIDKTLPLKDRLFEMLRNRSSKQALKRAAVNVFESNYIQQVADSIVTAKNPQNRTIYIGLPDHLADLSLLDSSVKHVEGQVCSITNGNPHKDNSTLIRCFAELLKMKPDVDWQLKIAGGLNPSLWETYEKLARDLGVFNRIEWLGFVDQDQLTNLLQSSLCLVSTSRVESFCMVALEAMGRGCPSVVADCTSMPESVGQAAFLVPPGDAKLFAEAILEIHDNESFRDQLVAKGNERVQSFRWDTCGKQFAEVFLNVAPTTK
jgi:glycosyltransferase involved in cell wall biosynthesis